MKKLIAALAVLALAGSSTFAYIKLRDDGESGKGPATAIAERGTLVEKALAVGEIVPRHEIAVKSKISGTVAQLFVQEGEYVEQGHPLLEVRPAPTPLEYAQARRTLEMRLLAEEQRLAELERLQGLLEQGMVSRAEHERAREAHAQARLQRRLADEELAILDRGRAEVAGRTVESVIYSPVSGHVLDIGVDTGDPVVPLTSYQPGTELMRLADMGELLFEGTVDEIDVGRIREGMPAQIKVGAFPGHLVGGTLQRIALKSGKRDNATVFEVEIGHLQVPEGVVLRAGYSANADIIVARAEQVLVLPERVLEFRGDSTFVRLPAAPGQEPVLHPVQIGLSDGIRVEVAAGLEEGAQVLEKEVREIR